MINFILKVTIIKRTISTFLLILQTSINKIYPFLNKINL